MEKWKKRKIEHSIDVLEKEIEIREGNELLEKLAKGKPLTWRSHFAS